MLFKALSLRNHIFSGCITIRFEGGDSLFSAPGGALRCNTCTGAILWSAIFVSGVSRCELELGVEKFRLVAAAAKGLLPMLPSFLTEDTEEQENEESLQRSEDSKEDLEGQSNTSDSDCECSKQPGKAEEEHDSSYADHQANDRLTVEGLVLTSQAASRVLDEDCYHYNVHYDVEKDDCQDWSQKCHKKYNGIVEEAAERDRNSDWCLQWLICTYN